ncbi:hypothetical protein [Nocardia sp. CC201C]|uniref:hypothetical protein n=1 Tax=Nocardia sp. CC201C TaxID=3044575 RepID=UPI0024A9738D|nr:hypothetical protein [Nocardia sp. CC201C]
MTERNISGEKYFVDKNGVPHKVGTRGDNPDAEIAFRHLNGQLRRDGELYNGTGSGSRYYFQADLDIIVPAGTISQLGIPKAVIADTVTGTTADMIRVTWNDGKIVDVRSVDATGSPVFGPLGDILRTINNKMSFTDKFQTQEVVFVAASEAQARMVFEQFEGNPNIRVIHPASGFDRIGNR